MATSASDGDRSEQFQLMQLVELVGPIVHEGNNFLNVVFLQVAILEMEASEPSRTQLKEIRRQGTAFKTLLQQLQSYRQRYQPPVEPVDVNQAIQRTLEELQRQRRLPRFGAATVQTTLEPSLPRVLGWGMELEQLLAFILINVTRTVGAEEMILSTHADPGTVRVRLARARPDVGRPSVWDADSLEGCASGSLVRRLGGKLAEDDGALVVELPPAL